MLRTNWTATHVLNSICYQAVGPYTNDPVLIELPRGSYAVPISPLEPGLDPPPVQTVAVLPFVNHGPDPDGECLADGLTEELIDRLAAIPEMRVVARTSVFQFKGDGGNVREIGRVLGARYLIEGSIRKLGNSLRVNARLIKSDGGYQLWSRTLTRPSATSSACKSPSRPPSAYGRTSNRTLLNSIQA